MTWPDVYAKLPLRRGLCCESGQARKQKGRELPGLLPSSIALLWQVLRGVDQEVQRRDQFECAGKIGVA